MVPKESTGFSLLRIVNLGCERDFNALLLDIHAGSLRNGSYDGLVLAADVIDKWNSLIVMHNFDTGAVRIDVNGVKKLQFNIGHPC